MKKAILSILLATGMMVAWSQSWNPYLNQGAISPAPLFPAELVGLGQFDFKIGNTGSSIIPLIQGDELQVVVALNGVIPSQNDPILCLSGSWLNYFTWTYESAGNVYHGIQNQDLPAESSGNIQVSCKVVQNNTAVASNNGVEARLEVPSFIGLKNHTMDDKVSSYTYTQAVDYGDAPASYGIAMHELNFSKVNGVYTKYIALGSAIDAERLAFNTGQADADDNDGMDDEDGVALPVFIQGGSVSIPVQITTHGNSYGFLKAWIDWNGDGDFGDAGEDVSGSATPFFNSTVIQLNVNVPLSAVPGLTYARFRVGNYGSYSGLNTWGEVEDYRVEILPSQPFLSVTIDQVAGANPVFEPGQLLTYRVKVNNIGSSNISGVQLLPGFPGTGINSLSNPIESMSSNNVIEVGESWSFTSTYTVTQQDIDNLHLLLYSVAASSTQYAGPAVGSCYTAITRWPALDAAIALSQSTEAELGQPITLTYHFINKGNVSLSNLSVNDQITGTGILTDVSPATINNVAVGDTATFTATYTLSPADVIAGTPLLLQTAGVANFDSQLLNASAQTTIAIKASQHKIGLLGLDADWLNSHEVNVNWRSSYEINNAFFEVLRRHQSEPSMYTIGMVSGAGNSLMINAYNYVDNVASLPEGWIYYSLDGTNLVDSVYQVGQTVIDELDGIRIALYPLPVKDILNVSISSDAIDPFDIQLFNSIGQLLSIDVEVEQDILRLNLGNLPPGVYHLQIRFGDELFSKKIVKS